ncbi:MAG: DNA repair protein RecO (recombination protein O) [Oceanicoccus sp.]|jgi:DNA repair protein RecO (recombination protein O)
MSRLRNLTAIVLRKRDLMERDLFITIMDDEGNCFDVVVKGAGSQKSKRRRHLERMNLIKGTLYEGKTHLYLQDVQCQSSHVALKDNLDSIMQASVLLELIERCILPNDPHPQIYKLVSETLEMMNKKDVQDHLLEISLIQLANHLGFLPNFKECSQCHFDKTQEDLYLDKTHGTLHCKDCNPSGPPLPMKYRKAIEFFKRTQITNTQEIKFEKGEQTELRELILELFQPQLHSPLKSLSLSY